MFGRRRFLTTLAAAGVSTLVPACAHPRFASYPFTLGVASGYPTERSVVLWTRLTGPLEPAPIEVLWEVASDEAMRRVVASGSIEASPRWAHSARVEVQNLAPGRWYWYRFRAGDARSPVGRTRTSPSRTDGVQQLRFAFGSCQHYEQGWFGAYRHIAADAPDLVAFLGDYIYEASWGRDHVRKHHAPEPYGLADYRARYALYRSDPDLQAAHAACPWIVTWDDHEVDNDYAADRPEDGMERIAFLSRRAAAYQAYYEHMPLPPRMQPEGGRMRIHGELDWGTLARFYVLDTRQYRSWQACPRPKRRGGSNTVDVLACEELAAPERSMLGEAQERWLGEALGASRARWNVIAQTTTMSQFDQLPGPGRRAWTDGWDGYPAARTRLLGSISRMKTENPVVIGGDVHSFNIAELKADFDDPRSPIVASEFIGTSITSQAWSQEHVNKLLPDNAHLLYADSRFRGYTRVEITPKLWRADLRGMESVQRSDAACSTVATYVVEDGRPGPLKA